MPYDHSSVEPKWQARWRDAGLHKTPSDRAKPKYYALDMFPYPSGAGLHVGHSEGYTATDIVTPLQADAGLQRAAPDGLGRLRPAGRELRHQARRPPARDHRGSIANFRRQIDASGFAYDWTREIDTTDPGYYKWTQWIFLQLYKTRPGLRRRTPINWCPVGKTGLANEEVIQRALRALRHPGRAQAPAAVVLGSPRYADRLLEDLDGLDWPDSTLAMQRNWIGRSEGAEVIVQERRTEAGDETQASSPPAPTPLRRDLHGALARAPAGRRADHASAARGRHGISGRGAPQERPRTDRAGQGQDRRLHRGVRDQPGQRRNDPDLDRRLRAGRLRHRRDHGRARRTTSATTSSPRSSGSRSCRSSGRRRRQQRRAGRGVHRRRRGRQLRLPRRPAHRRGQADHHALARGSAGSARAPSTTGCATGCSRASATGASRFPLIHCPTTAWCRCRNRAAGAPAGRRDYEPTGTGESPLAGDRGLGRHHLSECGGPAKRETNTMPQWAGSCWYYLRYLDPEERRARCSNPTVEK